MRVLLDECVPRKFKFQLTGHDCCAVPEAALAGRKNGELLVAAEEGVAYQQSLAGLRIAIIVVRTSSSRLDDLLPYVADCLNAIATAKPGSNTMVS